MVNDRLTEAEIVAMKARADAANELSGQFWKLDNPDDIVDDLLKDNSALIAALATATEAADEMRQERDRLQRVDEAWRVERDDLAARLATAEQERDAERAKIARFGEQFQLLNLASPEKQRSASDITLSAISYLAKQCLGEFKPLPESGMFWSDDLQGMPHLHEVGVGVRAWCWTCWTGPGDDDGRIDWGARPRESGLPITGNTDEYVDFNDPTAVQRLKEKAKAAASLKIAELDGAPAMRIEAEAKPKTEEETPVDPATGWPIVPCPRCGAPMRREPDGPAEAWE